jgi:hypothetical protein
LCAGLTNLIARYFDREQVGSVNIEIMATAPVLLELKQGHIDYA